MSTKEQTNTAAVRPFGWRDQLGYLSGNFAGDFTFTLCSGFMMKFYTDVMGVSAAVIGILMMVAQFADAFTDLTMGQICDRSKTGKNGKFRPLILRAAGPVALTSFLLYANWMKDAPMSIKIVWMFVTYLLYSSVFYTMFIIPYGSMASAISNDPVDRTKLSNWRHIGGTLSMTFINVIMPIAVFYKDPEGHEIFSGFRMSVAGFAFSLAAFILFLVCYFLTTERVKVPSNNEKLDVKAFVSDLLHNRGLIAIVLLILVQECSNSAFHGMSGYIFPNYFGNAAAMSISSIEETIITLAVAAVIVGIVAKTGKKEITVIGTLVSAAALGLGFILHTHSVVMWLVIYGLVTVGLSLFNPVTFALVTDIVDDEEVRTGKRIDGTIYSIYSFGRKFGHAMSSGIRGIMLTAAGYTAATAFDADVLNQVYNVSCLVPMIGFALMAAIVAFLYPLNKKKVEENVEILKKRHAEQ